MPLSPIRVIKAESSAVNATSVTQSTSSFAFGFHNPPNDDIYEDTGDLAFHQAEREVILARLPKFLWKYWSNLNDEEEITIGTVRVEGDLHKPQRMSMLLDVDLPINHIVPKEYNLHFTNLAPANTFVFIEKELPGASHSRSSFSQISEVLTQPSNHSMALFSHGLNPVTTAQGHTAKRYYQKAIPRQTSLTGCVQIELNCLPVENDEYRRVMTESTRQSTKTRRETQILSGLASAHAGNLLAPGTLGDAGGFTTFIKTVAEKKPKNQEIKSARIPQNELLDRIMHCFRRYTYWPLKSLKAELDQPEAYLKQTLELVARLVRQGPHAMTWQLKPESRIGANETLHSTKYQGDQAPENDYALELASTIRVGKISDIEKNTVRNEEVVP